MCIKPYFGREFDSRHLHKNKLKKNTKIFGIVKFISYLCNVIKFKVEASSNKTDYVTVKNKAGYL